MYWKPDFILSGLYESFLYYAGLVEVIKTTNTCTQLTLLRIELRLHV